MIQAFTNPPEQSESTICPRGKWLQMLDEERIQFIILDSHLDTELVKAIRSQPGWNVDSEDDELVIFTLEKRN
jgi:hypothetical protein